LSQVVWNLRDRLKEIQTNPLFSSESPPLRWLILTLACENLAWAKKLKHYSIAVDKA